MNYAGVEISPDGLEMLRLMLIIIDQKLSRDRREARDGHR